METVGEKLKAARLKKNISFERVYKATRMHPHVLEALEQDRAHNFLSFTYIKGFLKSYARYLGLDSERLFKEYIEARKIETPAHPEIALEKKDKISLFIKPFLVLRLTLVILLAVGLIFYFRYVLKNISAVSKSEHTQRVKVSVLPAPQAVAEDLILEVRTKQDCWIRVKADNQSIFAKTLPKGKRERWQAKEKIELRIGRPEALEVSLNGKRIDLKKADVKKSLVITHEGIVGK